MRWIYILFLALLTVGCIQGPVGPQGEPGQQGEQGIPGQDGSSAVGGHTVFQIESRNYPEDYNGLICFLSHEVDTSKGLYHAEAFFSKDSIAWMDLRAYTGYIEMSQSSRELMLDSSPQIAIASNGIIVQIADINQDLAGAYCKLIYYTEK